MTGSNSEADHFVVIGGGLAGVTTGVELSTRGLRVTLLEADAELGNGASHANGGILSVTRPEPWNAPGVFRHLASSLFDPRSSMKLRLRAVPGLGLWGLDFLRHSAAVRHRHATLVNYRLAVHSMAVLEHWRTTFDLEFDAARRGCLDLFPDEASLAGGEALVDALRAEGARIELLDRAGTLAVEPALAAARDRFACALYYPDDGVGDARRFLLALAAVGQQHGMQIRTRTRVDRLLVERGRVVGIEAAGERIAGSVVLAAGIDAPALARRAGLSLPIRPAKGYSVTIDAAPFGDAAPKLPVIDEAMHAGVSPLGDRLRLVGTAEFTGRDTRIRAERIDNLFALLERLFPEHAPRIDRGSAVPWAGLRPMTADGVPIVGASGMDGLWLNCGHGPLGWTLGPGSSRLLADLIERRTPAIDAASYSPERNRSGRR